MGDFENKSFGGGSQAGNWWPPRGIIFAYTMAKHADPNIPNEVEEWLDGFNTFSIYQVLPQLIELWELNVKTDVEAKKNFAQLSGK